MAISDLVFAIIDQHRNMKIVIAMRLTDPCSVIPPNRKYDRKQEVVNEGKDSFTVYQ